MYSLDASWANTSLFVEPHKALVAHKNNECIWELGMMQGRVIANVF